VNAPEHQPGRTAWQTWLDGLAEAAERLEQQLASGELLSFPDLTAPPVNPDSAGVPAEYLPRAVRALDRLERLERVATAQRDTLATQIHSLAGRRPRPVAIPSYELGSALDVAG
jgi:hypothetical protein